MQAQEFETICDNCMRPDCYQKYPTSTMICNGAIWESDQEEVSNEIKWAKITIPLDLQYKIV